MSKDEAAAAALGALAAVLLLTIWLRGNPAFRYAPNPPMISNGPLYPVQAAVAAFNDMSLYAGPGGAYWETSSPWTDPKDESLGPVRLEPQAGSGPRFEFDFAQFGMDAWPRVDAAAMTEAFARELSSGGLVDSAVPADPEYAPLQGSDSRAVLLIRGEIGEADVVYSRAGQGRLSLAMDFKASIEPPKSEFADFNPIWSGRFRQTLLQNGRPPLECENEILRRLYAQARESLAAALKTPRARALGAISCAWCPR